MTAYLQSGNIDRLLLLRMPAKNPPPGPLAKLLRPLPRRRALENIHC